MSNWLTSLWARIPSGPKLLLIMSAALLPLGVIAIIASVHSARVNSEQRVAESLSRLDRKAARLNELIVRTAAALQAAVTAIEAARGDAAECRLQLAQFTTALPLPGRYALFRAGGRLNCATEGFAPGIPALPISARGERVEISPDGQSLRLLTSDAAGRVRAVADFSSAVLRDLTYLPGTPTNFDLELFGNGRRVVLRDEYRGASVGQTLTDTEPVANGQLQLRMTLSATPIDPVEALLVLLPVMMWLGAGIIAWWVVNRQLIRPLATIRRAVADYKPGDRGLRLGRLRSPAREIGDLGAAFDNLTRTVATHEADLEAAVESQAKLVREVHHRVKNNLQVVASLLNLHSRGSSSEEAAAAYASIQRRVDALAVVHRNHFAELEEKQGVALKPLISEVAANLRATAPASAALMQIRIDVAPLYASQDTAVSVAFLVTEITEFGMLCGANTVSIVLEEEKPGRARLAIEADTLADEATAEPALYERFDRIITGLARQLRSPLEFDPAHGRYSVRFAIVPAGNAS